MEAMDNLPAVFRERMGEVSSGALDIAAGESTILYLLPDYVKRFSDRYPQISLHLHNVTGRDGLALLRSGDVDLAVGSMIEVPHDITYVPIFRYEPMLITPLDHPLACRERVTLEDISHCGLILPPRHLSTWRIVDLVLRKHGLDYHVVLEAGGWEVIKKFVELGLGVSVVTSICLTGNEKLAVTPLCDYFPTRSYGVVMRKRTQLSPQAYRFVEMLDPDFAGRSKEVRGGARGAVSPRGMNRPGAAGQIDFTGDDQSLP
jgi:DNA-binding transcriptional LysR family regulator